MPVSPKGFIAHLFPPVSVTGIAIHGTAPAAARQPSQLTDDSS
jgi:hypothetical protein